METTKFKTLIKMLRFRAATTPDKTAFTFNDQPCTYRQMWQNINRFSVHLQKLGVLPGDRVVMTLPNSAEFFFAFYGAMRAGAIAVPVFPGFGPAHVLSIVKLCGANIIVAPSTTPPKLLAQFKSQAELYNLWVITVAESENAPFSVNNYKIKPDDVAFLQYTSGSTGNPKGVQLSHRNLLTNVRQMIAGMRITKDEIFVSWLPVYHDMGLILKTMVPFYLGADIILLPTSLKNVNLWLEAIQKYCATFTAAPDFAYRLCLRQIKNPQTFNLSSLRVALNAAEPVRHQTILDFEQAFALENVMVPGYGLAEATVGVSMWPPQTSVKVDERGYVSVGPPFPKIEITILKEGQPVGPNIIGEIAIKSPANSCGYFNNPEATHNLFHNSNTILSGDLGYLDEAGNLFIAGRKKNTIIHAGRTIYPREIQELVDLHPDVRYSAAVGIDKGRIEGEQVYVFAEIRNSETALENALQTIVIDIVERIHGQMGFRPGRVYLVKPKTIPLTYNGKFQHIRLKEMYLAGTLFEEGRIVYPGY